MAEKRRGLGRGLGSLIPSQETGRPSDVFFPRGERAEPEDSADAPTAEKKSSDPAESMRRAQAGRRTGAAKRAPAKASQAKSGSSTRAASAPPAEKRETPAKKAGAPAEKKPAASSRKTGSAPSSRSTARSAPSSTTAATAESSDTPQTSVKPLRTNASRDSESKTTIDVEDQTTAPQAEEATASHETSSAEMRHDSIVDGVYVSRETVRGHRAADDEGTEDAPSTDRASEGGGTVEESASSAEAPHVGTGVADADMDQGIDDGIDEASADEAPAFGSHVDDEPARSDRVDGGEGSEHSSESDVPRETDDDPDDSAEDLVPVPGTTFGEIPLDRIRPNPRQPRGVFDEDALDELITSIREIGVLQPVVVRRRPDAPGQYELIMGERRYRASKEADTETIPAIVRETKNDDLLRDALLENLHRVDLNPLEEAAAYAQLLEDFNCTQDELSERIGRSRPQISNTIRLLRLPAMVQRRVAAGVLSSGHARALLGLNDGANMEVLAQRVVAEGLSVRATEEAVVLLNRGDRSAVSRGTREPDPELAQLARSLGDRLETRVNVVMGKRKGKLSVEFANGEDLNRILSLLGLERQSDGE